jgi:hypothetical protein
MLTGCQTTHQEPPTRITVNDSYHAGKFDVPLPPGKWIVSGSRIYYTSHDTEMVDVFLATMEPGQQGDVIWIKTNLVSAFRPGVAGWVENSTCKRTNMLFVKAYFNEEKQGQDCWIINHRRITPSNSKNQAIISTRNFMREHEMQLPVNTVDVRFFFANDEDLLHVTYYFNPEARGIKRPEYASWNSSDWHIDRIDEHPEKRKFATELETWGKRWYPKLKANFVKAIN